MANKFDIVVPSEEDVQENASNQMTPREQALVSWIVPRVREWCEYRDNNYSTKWNEYYRLYRGFWSTEDKNRESERSKIITPALQQAVESAVAELEEAAFGKAGWFDLADDYDDQQKGDMLPLRDKLLNDLTLAKVPDEAANVILNAALYGTGLAEIIVETVPTFTPKVTVDPETGGPNKEIEEKEQFQVRIESIHPKEFAIDPAARNLEEALGCAHVPLKPRHTIVEKQLAGIYKDYDLGSFPQEDELQELIGNYDRSHLTDYVKVTKYFGKVPAALIDPEVEEDEEVVELFPVDQMDSEEGVGLYDDTEMVEAIVFIANDQTILKAVKNPYIKKDRPILYFPYEKMDKEFWGRGISEKGFNSQKALDAEMRARIDAMALTTHPMMAVDAGRLPRGQSLTVRPGKIWLTNGPPGDIFQPMNFGKDISPHTFSQSGELERMVQMATGSMDSATPIATNRRNETASGMSMIHGGFIKRSKRTMRSLSVNFLNELIHKAAWRYMQFDPERYPFGDYRFKVSSAVGIMARELEQSQLINLLSVVPQDSPAFGVLLKGIFDNSSMTNKAEMVAAIEQTLQPNPEQAQLQQASIQLELQNKQLENLKIQGEIEKLQAQTIEILAKAQQSGEKIEVEKARARLEALRTIADSLQVGINQERVEIERMKINSDKNKAKSKNE